VRQQSSRTGQPGGSADDRSEPVATKIFRPEQVTEGSVAIGDDLTTPVFSHYSGRVIKVIAMLGDVVAPGAPLFVIHASEFVQAQNDLITALANLQTARSLGISACHWRSMCWAHPDRVFKGKISWVAPSIDPNTHRLPVRADVEHPYGALKPGMFANFSIITGEASAIP
jgi:multidrug efflux pump subunit AcrA (membrane-fusion protein)